MGQVEEFPGGKFTGMTQFSQTWQLTRKRFEDAVSGLRQDQLNWRLHPDTLTIGEMALHVCGTEVSFVSQLLGAELDAETERLKMAATDSVVNDRPFPYAAEDITPELVASSFDKVRAYVEPVITDPPESIKGKEIVSVLGPVIDWQGAFARLSYHPGYHQGQVHIVRSSPGFPS